MFSGLFLASVIALCVWGSAVKGFAADLRILVWLPYMLAMACSDLLGERFGSGVPAKRTGENILQGKLMPLQSEHWGEHS
jgi:hypothetical protein